MKILYIWLFFVAVDLILIKDYTFSVSNFGERYFVNIFFSSLALFSILYLLQNFRMRYIFLILVIPVFAQMTYFEIYRKFVSPFGLQTFFEDSEMVFSLWIENINFWKSISLLIIFFVILRSFQRESLKKWLVALNSFYLVLFFSFSTFSWYSVSNFGNSVVSFYGTFFELAKVGAISNFKIDRPNLEKSERKELPNIIYIVGESTVFRQMSLFGNDRDTTPNLRQLEKESKLIGFKNVVSIGTKTRLSLPYMLVGLDGIDPKGEIYKYPTIMNYMKSIGYKTIFITSQDLSWGGIKDLLIDNSIDLFVNGTKYNPNARVHKGADDLEMVEKEILPIIENEKEPFFIVFQMDGSHYPYSKHSPKEFKIWNEDPENPNSINAYDNSLIYTDTALNKVIRKMRDKFPSSWVFFSPDHGQNLGGESGMFNDNFSKDVVHNPLLISSPKEFLVDLREKIDYPISQSDIVPTILDIVKIDEVKPLDGFSILGKIPKDRLRVSSTYMPTLHNTPEATLIFPDLSYFYIDFAKKSVVLRDGKSAIEFNELNDSFKKALK